MWGWYCSMASKGIFFFLLLLPILFFLFSHIFLSLLLLPSPTFLNHLTSSRSQKRTVDTIILLHYWLNEIINVLAMKGGTREHQLLQVANKGHKVLRGEVTSLIQGHSGTRIKVSWLPILLHSRVSWVNKELYTTYNIILLMKQTI